MVHTQLKNRGIHDSALLRAFDQVPRHCFIPLEHRAQAYADYPLPIGYDQTISQPDIVAYMLQKLTLQGSERVLEIGTGSGYQTALLAMLVDRVYTIELNPELADRARKVLAGLGYCNIDIQVGDGTGGWPDKAPFEAIIGSAAPADVPPTLLDQLTIGGRLIMPIGTFHQQLLLVLRTRDDAYQRTPLLAVRFVPMRSEKMK